jgi:hypothetical protein
MTTSSSHRQLTLSAFWESTCHRIFELTQRMPKSVRVSLAQRIESVSLDVLEQAIEATYLPPDLTRAELSAMRRALNRLQVLMRFAYNRQVLSFQAYEEVAYAIDQAGRMVTAWRKALK